MQCKSSYITLVCIVMGCLLYSSCGNGVQEVEIFGVNLPLESDYKSLEEKLVKYGVNTEQCGFDDSGCDEGYYYCSAICNELSSDTVVDLSFDYCFSNKNKLSVMWKIPAQSYQEVKCKIESFISYRHLKLEIDTKNTKYYSFETELLQVQIDSVYNEISYHYQITY